MKNIAPYTVSEPFPGLYVIDEGGVRCFLIPGEDKALLIDTGFGRGDLAAQVREITDLPVRVVHTHADGDHMGTDAQFEDISMHPAEYDHFAMSLERMKLDKAALLSRVSPVWEGDKLSYGDYCFEIILIPGHTPGSIAFLDRAHRLLIGGDSIQTGEAWMFGPGRSMYAYYQSMKKLEALRPAFDTVLASHVDLLVGADILPELVEGAKAYLDGALEGQPFNGPAPAKIYSFKRARFLC